MRIIENSPKFTSYTENISIPIFLNASKQNKTPKYDRDKGKCHPPPWQKSGLLQYHQAACSFVVRVAELSVIFFTEITNEPKIMIKQKM
jgi:hypothetical protein